MKIHFDNALREQIVTQTFLTDDCGWLKLV